MPLRLTMVIPARRADIAAVLEGLVRLNELVLNELNLPPLYATDVRFRREARGVDEWLNVRELYRRGFGDCEDMAAARAAELRHGGEFASAIAIRTGPRMFHAIVQRADGRLEDPTRVMRFKERHHV